MKYLDITNFDFGNAYLYTAFDFSSLVNLEYINIYNIKNYNGFFMNAITASSGLNNRSGLIVCQSNYSIITNPNATYECCRFPNNSLICEDNNIMTTSNILFTSEIYSSSFLENKYTTNKIIETTEFFKTSIPENKESITSTFVDIIEESINNINTTNIEEITTFESSLI